jgi:hypothetical protein
MRIPLCLNVLETSLPESGVIDFVVGTTDFRFSVPSVCSLRVSKRYSNSPARGEGDSSTEAPLAIGSDIAAFGSLAAEANSVPSQGDLNQYLQQVAGQLAAVVGHQLPAPILMRAVRNAPTSPCRWLPCAALSVTMRSAIAIGCDGRRGLHHEDEIQRRR